MSSKANQLQKSFGQLVILDSSSVKLGSTSSVSLTKAPAGIVIREGEVDLIASEILSGILITGGISSANDTVLRIPSASSLIASFNNTQVGDTFNFSIINLAPINYNTIIIGDGSGTLVGNPIVAPTRSSTFLIRFTNITPGTETYTVYNLAC